MLSEKFEEVRQLAASLNGEERRLLQIFLGDMKCPGCEHFDAETNTCVKFNRVPPAKVIAVGCREFAYQVPF